MHTTVEQKCFKENKNDDNSEKKYKVMLGIHEN